MKSNHKKVPDLFGNPFDLNGDGKTDACETTLMFMMFDEMQKEENYQKQTCSSPMCDLDEIDLGETTIDLDDLYIKGI